MKSILTQIEQLTNASIEALETSLSLEMLEAVRIEFLGRKGKIANLMPLLSDLSLEDKRVVGPLMNELKAKVEQLFEARTTKRGRLFRDNVTNLLTGLFLILNC